MKIRLLQVFDKNIKKLPFRSKLTYYLVITVCVTVLIVFFCSYFVTSRSIKQQAKDITMQQLEQNTLNLENYLKNIENTSDSIVTDKSFQEYLSNPDEDTLKFMNNVDGVYQTMSNVLEAKKDILYIYLYKVLNDKALFLGPTKAGSDADYSEVVEYLSQNGITGTPIRVGFRNDPIINSKYTITIYQPIFDIYKIKKPIGMLSMTVAEDVVSGFYSHRITEIPLETFIMDGSGKVVSHIDKT